MKDYSEDWFFLYDHFFTPRKISVPSNSRLFERFISDLFNYQPELFAELNLFLEENSIENIMRIYGRKTA